MNSHRAVRQSGLVTLLIHRSFSRSAHGFRLTQGGPSGQQERSWVNATCIAAALMGLSLSFFSTRQLCDDPNRRCLLWKKSGP